MNYPPITRRCLKGVLRWNRKREGWDWVKAGPYFLVRQLWNGEWRVNRVRL